MDSPVTFPEPEPALKLARPSAEKWAATLAEERLRLQDDQEALREREDNLREYESRLRSLQAEIESVRTQVANQPSYGSQPPLPTRTTPSVFHRPSSRTPFTEDPGLQAAWEKLHRAREILEAEQKNLRDDRITMREQESMLKRREEDITERETRLAEREALVTAATPSQPVSDGSAVSAVTRFTRAPYEMARSVFGGRKSG